MRKDKILMLEKILSSGDYEVDINLGKVYSLKNKLKIEIGYINKYGNKTVGLSYNRKRYMYPVSNIITFSARKWEGIENPETYHVICKDGNKKDTSINNLEVIELGELREREKGLVNRKATDIFKVKILRKEYDNGTSVAELSRKHDIPYTTVSQIVRRKHYKRMEESI